LRENYGLGSLVSRRLRGGRWLFLTLGLE
jgi:hypothetical protein